MSGGRDVPARVKARELAPGVWSLDGSITRCFLLAGEEKALLIDTGDGGMDVSALARNLTDRPVTAINTHFHWDHIGGNRLFEHVYAHPDTFPYMDNGSKPLPVREGFVFELGGISAEVLKTPGHTPGGLSLLCRERGLIFVGDNISDEVIYMHHEYCDLGLLAASIRRTIVLTEDWGHICCCHGSVIVPPGVAESCLACALGAASGQLAGRLTEREYMGGIKTFRAYTFDKALILCSP